MNPLIDSFGLDAWKPLLTALLLPPVPLLLLVLIGARLMLGRRGWGWSLIALGVALLWLSATWGAARLLTVHALQPPAALARDRIAELKALPKAATAVIVLGGGMEPYAPEYGLSNLRPLSMERLRYGLYLGRETGLAVGFSGGVGWAQPDATAEARIAARIAAAEFGRPLKWVEDESRDTRENARRSVALLGPAGIRRIVLVTHAWHMPRALRAFRAAAGDGIEIEPAPMGLARSIDRTQLDWLPSANGFTETRHVLRELLARAGGA